ncbi:MAG: hypothetical protein Q4P05_02585 [Actinomycetaceae bacterium]|nr:hypothetical protein [Actinomycetaceae bacterium]
MYDLPALHVDHAIALLDDALDVFASITLDWSGPSAQCARHDIAQIQAKIVQLLGIVGDTRQACVVAEQEKQLAVWSALALGL